MAAGQGFVAVVGARVLPERMAPQVADVVRLFLARGWGIGSGGARGADDYALHAVLAAGPAACARSVVFLPGAMPTRADALHAFVGRGGRVVPGAGGGRVALLARSRRLAREAAGVVAFLWGPSRGSVFTVREAIRAGKPAAVVLAGGGAVLPAFGGGRWAPCSLGSLHAFRWHPEPRDPSRSSWLARVFHVPAGEPTHAQLEHIASLSAGERLWFERGILAGDTVLVPHEALSDTPAFLATRRLMRRFRCDVREAAGLAELFLALEAGPGVVAHYEHEARGVGVTAIIEDLVHLVACLALSEQAPETDALGHADTLGDGVEWVDEGGRVAQAAVQSREEAAPPDVQWHALGTVQPERVTCPVCRAVTESDRRRQRAADLRRVRHAGHLGSAAGRALPRHRGRDRRLLLPRSAGGARQATLCARAHARSGWRRVVALPRVQDGPRAGRDAPAARARPRRSRGARHAAIPSAARGAAVPVAARWRRVHLHHRVAADLGGVPGAPGRGRRVGRPRAVAAGRRARSAMLARVARPSACTPRRTPWPRSPTCAAEQARRGFDRAPGTRCSRAWRGRRPQSPTRRVTSLGSASIARAERECSTRVARPSACTPRRTPWPRSPSPRGAADVVRVSPTRAPAPRLAALASNLIGSGWGVTRPEGT